MGNLNYDVARIFIKTGQRIKPKCHSYEWKECNHSSHSIRIGDYSLFCDYHSNDWPLFDPKVSVRIFKVGGTISFDLADIIYNKFKDESPFLQPTFTYNGYTTIGIPQILSNDELSNVKYELDSGRPFSMYKNTNYFSKYREKLDEHKKNSEIRKNGITSIQVYTFEELDFIIKLLRSEESIKKAS